MSKAGIEILVIDDDVVDFKPGLSHVLQDYTLRWAEAGEEAFGLLEQHSEIALVLLDLKMPPHFAKAPHREGIEILRRLRQGRPELPVIMLTVLTDVELVVEAIQLGAFHYLTKPFDRDRLREIVKRALENRELKKRVDSLSRAKDTLMQAQAHPGRQDGEFCGIVGSHPLMQQLYGLIEQVAPHEDMSVVILGESGAGKDLVAQAIHACSARRDGPFVAINCAGFSEEGVLQSELFGHEKGAFTGADHSRQGVFREAHGGTLFLDEVADMPLAVQAQLLRVLETGEVRTVGGTGTEKVDVRVVCATNKDLVKARKEGEFREDLYYRLCDIPLSLPPLRNRREDIPALVSHFLGEQGPVFEDDALGALVEYEWPGNIRQLVSVLKHLRVLCAGGTVSQALVDAVITQHAQPGTPIDIPMQPARIMRERPAASVTLEETPIQCATEEAAPEVEERDGWPVVNDLNEFQRQHGELRLKQVIEDAIRETGSGRGAMELLSIPDDKYDVFRTRIKRLGIRVRDLT